MRPADNGLFVPDNLDFSRLPRSASCGATIGDQPPADLRRIFIRQLQIFGSTLGNPDEFSGLMEWCSDGRLLPLIDARYPLGQICAAFSHLRVGCAVRESSDRYLINVRARRADLRHARRASPIVEDRICWVLGALQLRTIRP